MMLVLQEAECCLSGVHDGIDSNIFVQDHLLVILSVSEESRCPKRKILR